MTYTFLPTPDPSIAPPDVVQYVTPSNLGTVSVDTTTTILIVNPATTLAAVTFNLPTASYDGQYLTLVARKALTLVTMAGAGIIGTLLSMLLGGFAKFRFRAADNIWDRVG